MLIACVQTDVAFANLDENQARIVDFIPILGKRQTKLAVFPECMLCGYGFESREQALRHAIPIDHKRISDIAELAAAYDLYATFGFLESSGEQLFNAAVMVGPGGIVGHYRKVHLPHLGVDRFVDQGDIAYQAFAAGEAKVGLAICYDSSFPEPMRVLGLEGADIIALGTNWPVAAQRTAEIVPAARSMENHLFFVAANRIGFEQGFQYCGMSTISGPDGVILARSTNDEPTILFADVDLAVARNKRIERTAGKHVIDRFKDRRPKFYGRIVDH